MVDRIGTLKLVLFAIACIAIGLEIANQNRETMGYCARGKRAEVKVVKDAFSAVPIFAFTAYVVSWLILVLPGLWRMDSEVRKMSKPTEKQKRDNS